MATIATTKHGMVGGLALALLVRCAFPEMKVVAEATGGIEAGGTRTTGGAESVMFLLGGGTWSEETRLSGEGTPQTIGGGGNTLGENGSLPGDGGREAGGGAGGFGVPGGTMAAGGGPTSGGIGAAGGSTGGTTAAGGITGGGGLPASGGVEGAGCVPSVGVSYAPELQSCEKLAPICQGESCCTTISVPGGTFMMGRSLVPGASDYTEVTMGDNQELPEHEAEVATYALDKYEVTVSRFRNFVSDYQDWHTVKKNPVAGGGAYRLIPGTGWGESWDPQPTDLPASTALLKKDLTCSASATWTDDVGDHETAPINCVDWYLAFAFCIWDGGRLATDAEWEYASAGGSNNRMRPWGSAPSDESRANYATYAGNFGDPLLPVGSKPNGAGCYGQLDLAGSMYEWVFDWFSMDYYGTPAQPTACHNCANTTPNTNRVVRGGGWRSRDNSHRAANRYWMEATHTDEEFGFRCARVPTR